MAEERRKTKTKRGREKEDGGGRTKGSGIVVFDGVVARLGRRERKREVDKENMKRLAVLIC